MTWPREWWRRCCKEGWSCSLLPSAYFPTWEVHNLELLEGAPGDLGSGEQSSLYSPHTASDAVPQRVNSLLARRFGVCTSRPIHPSQVPNYPVEGTHGVEFNINHTQDLDKVTSTVKGISDISVTSFSAQTDDEGQTRSVWMIVSRLWFRWWLFFPRTNNLIRRTEILSLEKALLLHTGMGWWCTPDESVSLATMIEWIKRHLKRSHVRPTLGVGRTLEFQVKAVALCIGSRSSVLGGSRGRHLPHRWDVPSWYSGCDFPRNKCHPQWT